MSKKRCQIAILSRFYTSYFTKNQAVCSWFGRPISNNSTGQRYQFFDLKIQILFSFSFYFLQELSNPLLFAYCTVDAIPKSWNTWLAKCDYSDSTFWEYIASTVCKKQWIWQLRQKEKENENYRSEFSDQKNWYIWPVDLFEIGLPNQLHKAWFFMKCKCSNSYSVHSL